MNEKYFDYAATSPINMSVIEFVLEEYGTSIFGNPSCSHDLGFKAATLLQTARSKISQQLRCKSENIIFTSGGTESDNMAIKGVMLKYKPGEAELITSTIEHPAVLNSCKQLEKMGYTVFYVKPNAQGIILADSIKPYITSKTKLISIMTVNNEIGTIQPMVGISKLAHDNNILLHTDAVQAICKINLDLSLVDMASFSGHKFGSLKGSGFLYKKEDIELEPLICGGGQENNYRSGTENVFGNMVMAICLERNYEQWIGEATSMLQNVNDKFIKDLKNEFGENIIVNSNSSSVPDIINIAFKYIDSETLQLMLSGKGFQVSVGSACHSGNSEPSYVLKSIGVPDDFIKGALRISLTPNMYQSYLENLKNEIIFFVKYLLKKEDNYVS